MFTEREKRERTMHGHSPGKTLMACVLATLLVLALPAGAEELTLESFVDVTIVRLELAVTTWSDEGRSPSEAEEDDLFEEHDTLADHYFRFASERHVDIGSYLEDHPLERNEIDILSRQVRQLIEQEEAE